MLWVPRKANLSLFSTNTDRCGFKRGLVLVKHDKVRDDTPLVTKVRRSSNASAVAFFPSSLANLLFMYQLPIKGESLSEGREERAHVFVCFAASLRWSWKMRKLTRRRQTSGGGSDRLPRLWSDRVWQNSDLWCTSSPALQVFAPK